MNTCQIIIQALTTNISMLTLGDVALGVNTLGSFNNGIITSNTDIHHLGTVNTKLDDLVKHLCQPTT